MDSELHYFVSLALKVWRVMRLLSWDDWLSAIVIYRLYRRTRYLSVALRRQHASSLKEQNETVRRLLEIFTRAPPPRLRDLANDSEWDSRLR